MVYVVTSVALSLFLVPDMVGTTAALEALARELPESKATIAPGFKEARPTWISAWPISPFVFCTCWGLRGVFHHSECASITGSVNLEDGVFGQILITWSAMQRVQCVNKWR